MSDSVNVSDLLNALLGAGGVGFIAAAYKGVKDYRKGTWQRQDGAIADLEKWRKSADDAREWEQLQGEYWHNWAGTLEHVVRTELGPEALPVKEPYPVRPPLEVRK